MLELLVFWFLFRIVGLDNDPNGGHPADREKPLQDAHPLEELSDRTTVPGFAAAV